MKSYFLLRKQSRTDRPPEFQDDYHYPEEMVVAFLKEYTREGDLVFDPFAGFGTTLVAAEKLGRVPLGLEYLPDRVEFIRRRLTAKDAIIHGDARHIDALDLPPIDFSITSPPWMLKEDPQDPLTAYQEIGGGYAAYLRELQEIYRQLARAMRPGAVAVIDAANLKRDNQLTTLAWDIAGAVSQVMQFQGELVICWEGEGIGDAGYDHQYCLIFQKP
jgi:DNA modification methylase